mgnify:CR=1 FL=1
MFLKVKMNLAHIYLWIKHIVVALGPLHIQIRGGGAVNAQGVKPQAGPTFCWWVRKVASVASVLARSQVEVLQI